MEIDRSKPMDKSLLRPGAAVVLPGKYKQEPPPGMEITWRLATVLSEGGMGPGDLFIWGMQVANWPGYTPQIFRRSRGILEQSFRGRYISLATDAEIQEYMNQARERALRRRSEVVALWDEHILAIEKTLQRE